MDKDFIMEMLYVQYMHIYGSQSYIASSHFYQDLIDKGLKPYLKELYIYDGNDLDDWFIYLTDNGGSRLLDKHNENSEKKEVKLFRKIDTSNSKARELNVGELPDHL